MNYCWKYPLVCLFLFALAQGAASAGSFARKDSLTAVVIQPGLTHMSVLKDGPCSINVLVLDLHATNLRVESYRPVGLVRTSEQAKRNDKDGHKVIGAINADFFSFKTGWPVNNQIRNGEFVFGTQTPRSHFILDDRNMPHIERTSFEGWAGRPRGNKFRIAGVNDVHSDSVIILYTTFSDSATRSTGKGKTISLTLLNTSWSVCDTMRMIVNGSGSEDLENISSGKAVLWIGNGASVSPATEEMKSGDTLLVYLGIRPAIKNARTILGGFGKIVSDGRPVSDSTNLEEKTNLNFLTARHPRTFVGFDRDSTKLYLCVVDGRQQKSVGMNFREMADFLISIGVWNAVNFDGGGSTTMVVQGRIVNSPSDVTGERPVANTLQIIELAPPGNAR